MVIATIYGLLGAVASLLGIGPQVRPASDEVRLAGVIAIALGATLLLAAAALALRPPGARVVAVAGAIAMVILGAMVGLLSVASLDDCATGARAAAECRALIGAVGLTSLAVMAFGVGSMIVILRTPPRRYRRRRR